MYDNEALEKLVKAVLKSSKYRFITHELIQHIGAQELAKRRNFKEALKATKNKLHQIGGAYQNGSPNYSAWLAELEPVVNSPDELRHTCQQLMSYHASTKERLPILGEFYTTLLADLAPVHSVLDLACGLNPLAIPWMPLTPSATYYAYDIYHDMMDFISAFLNMLKIKGYAQARDIRQMELSEKVDLVFILKTLPCLEQIDKSASLDILEKLQARYIVISFPVKSLGGHNKNMVENYEQHLQTLLASKNWPIKRYLFSTELAFVIDKQG